MEVYLIRHSAPKIDKGICYGQTDIELDETLFTTTVQAIQRKLPSNIGQVYSSPLSRCQALAQQLSGHVILDSRLKELHFGDWEHKRWEDIKQTDLNNWMQDFVHVKAGRGESYLELHQRTLDFIRSISSEKNEKVAIVTHAGNIRSFIAYVLGLPLEHSFRLQVNYGDVVSITLGQSESLHRLNVGSL